MPGNRFGVLKLGPEAAYAGLIPSCLRSGKWSAGCRPDGMRKPGRQENAILDGSWLPGFLIERTEVKECEDRDFGLSCRGGLETGLSPFVVFVIFCSNPSVRSPRPAPR